MLAGMILGSLVWVAAVGGKVALLTMATWPVIGGLAAWYFDLIGPLSDGLASNLVYGVMAAQVIFLPLGALLYVPGWIRRLWLLLRENADAVSKTGNI